MDNNTIEIKNFNIGVFKHILLQGLMVNNQLMLEITDQMLKSCSFSDGKSLMKLVVIPTQDLVMKIPQIESENLLFDEAKAEVVEHLSFEKFNFYILKGDIFTKNLSMISTTEKVDVIFDIRNIEGTRQAASITLIGKSINGSPLKTTFTLTTEEMMTNLVSDYEKLIMECTPEATLQEIILTNKQTQEVKRLVKTLHKSVVNNTSYLTFTVKDKQIIINDKVFNITFTLSDELYSNGIVKIEEDIVFNILKSDFIMSGNLNLNIYTSNDSPKIIIGSKYGGALIWCLATKISEKNIQLVSDDSINNAIDDLQLGEYGLENDDVPF